MGLLDYDLQSLLELEGQGFVGGFETLLDAGDLSQLVVSILHILMYRRQNSWNRVLWLRSLNTGVTVAAT